MGNKFRVSQNGEIVADKASEEEVLKMIHESKINTRAKVEWCLFEEGKNRSDLFKEHFKNADPINKSIIKTFDPVRKFINPSAYFYSKTKILFSFIMTAILYLVIAVTFGADILRIERWRAGAIFFVLLLMFGVVLYRNLFKDAKIGSGMNIIVIIVSIFLIFKLSESAFDYMHSKPYLLLIPFIFIPIYGVMFLLGIALSKKISPNITKTRIQKLSPSSSNDKLRLQWISECDVDESVRQLARTRLNS